MPIPNFLTNLHKSLDRLASFALCVERAPRSRSSTAVQLAKTYADRLQRTIQVPPEAMERVRHYLIDRVLADRYLDDRSDRRSILERLAAGDRVLQLQDWYLSDPNLPSSAGRQKDDSFERTVAACAEIQLISSTTLTIDPYGSLIVALAREDKIIEAFEDSVVVENPFRPQSSTALALGFQLLRCDWVFLRELAKRFPDRAFSFRDEIASDALGILQSIAAAVPPSPANRASSTWLAKQVEHAKRIGQLLRHENAGKRQTLFRPLEDTFVPRLELFVDLGILLKPERGRFVYEKAAKFSRFSAMISGSPTTLESEFFAVITELWNRPVDRLEGDLEILDHLRPAAERLKGITGYVGIVEATIYANAMSVRSTSGRVVEVGKATEAVRRLAALERPPVRIIADRFRRPRDFALT